MKQEEFNAKLEMSRSAPLWGWLPKYQHIERMGSDEVDGLLDGEVYVQTKIDGANATVAWDVDAGLVIATRNRAISIGGKPETGMRGLVEYVLGHPGFERVASQGYILRGEWLIKHSIAYGKDAWNHLYVFDVQRVDDGAYLTPEEYGRILEDHAIRYVPVIARFSRPSMEALTSLVSGPDAFGAEQKEGVVVKRPGFVNRYGRVTWGKIVAADFKEKNRLAFGASKADAPEMRFAAGAVSTDSVMKLIHKIEDAKGQPANVRDMAQVIGRAWHEAFSEELWDFVNRERVREFNFGEARRLVEAKTREIALAHFNGAVGGVK